MKRPEINSDDELRDLVRRSLAGENVTINEQGLAIPASSEEFQAWADAAAAAMALGLRLDTADPELRARIDRIVEEERAKSGAQQGGNPAGA
ncbi:MAG: hypothetical protein ING59_12515 [Burkholderiales bacterium]|nr:hypothetical protein [Burkholderiales bacterium]